MGDRRSSPGCSRRRSCSRSRQASTARRRRFPAQRDTAAIDYSWIDDFDGAADARRDVEVPQRVVADHFDARHHVAAARNRECAASYSLRSGWGANQEDPATGKRSSANRSPSHIEPVSGMPKRKLENGEQRLAPQSHQSRAESPEFASQRLGHARITGGNVGSSRTARNRIGETALAGWGGRIRTLESREAAS
jgi:hypothetical protein